MPLPSLSVQTSTTSQTVFVFFGKVMRKSRVYFWLCLYMTLCLWVLDGDRQQLRDPDLHCAGAWCTGRPRCGGAGNVSVWMSAHGTVHDGGNLADPRCVRLSLQRGLCGPQCLLQRRGWRCGTARCDSDQRAQAVEICGDGQWCEALPMSADTCRRACGLRYRESPVATHRRGFAVKRGGAQADAARDAPPHSLFLRAAAADACVCSV